jgi:hypothetical protein
VVKFLQNYDGFIVFACKKKVNADALAETPQDLHGQIRGIGAVERESVPHPGPAEAGMRPKQEDKNFSALILENGKKKSSSGKKLSIFKV